jgi:hypothetical protein
MPPSTNRPSASRSSHSTPSGDALDDLLAEFATLPSSLSSARSPPSASRPPRPSVSTAVPLLPTQSTPPVLSTSSRSGGVVARGYVKGKTQLFIFDSRLNGKLCCGYLGGPKGN